MLVPGLALTGIGAGFFYPSITTAAVTMLDASRSSLAGGITYMFQIAGGADRARADDRAVREPLGGPGGERGEQGRLADDRRPGRGHPRLPRRHRTGDAAFNQFDTSVADKVLDVVKDSFVGGIQLSLRVVAAIALIGLVIAILGVRPKSTAPEPAKAEPADGTAPEPASA